MAKSGESEIALLRARVAELEAKLTAPALVSQPEVEVVEPEPPQDLPIPAETRRSPAEVRAALDAEAKAKKKTTKAKAAPKPRTKAEPKPKLAPPPDVEAVAVADDEPPIDVRQTMLVAGVALFVLVAGFGVLLFKGGAPEEDPDLVVADLSPASWVYRTIGQAGDITRTACVRSSSLVAQPPPAEPVRAELCLLDSESQGKDAYIALLGPGRLSCGGECRLQADFGAGDPLEVAGRSVEGSDHMVFVRDLPQFEVPLGEAETTKFTIGVGAPDMQKVAFSTAGLDWEGGLAEAAMDSATQATGTARRDGIWLRQPTRQEISAVYPAAARRDGRGGQATLACIAGEGGALTACTIASERPRGYGFGRAALQLSTRFRVRPGESGAISAVVSFAANNVDQRSARSNGQIYLAPIGAGQDFGRQRIPQGAGAQAVTLGQQDDTVRIPGGQGQVVQGDDNPAPAPSQPAEQAGDVEPMPGV